MKGEVRLFKKVFCLALTLFVIAGSLPTAFAQDDKRKKEQEKRQREEIKSVYKNWLEQDVAYIITDDERKAFKALKTDEERDQFIEQFWLRRDPDPDTPDNEYKEQYFERIQYANERFASGIPGWKTDRGRIYVMFGKPDQIESHPAGGSYNRPTWEGGGNTSTYPFEIWWYRHIDGIGTDIEIEFVDPSGSGEYRIARSPYEKDALLYVPNAGNTLAEQLGMENRGDRISNQYGGGWGGSRMFGGRAKDQPFERLQLLADLQKAPAIKYPDLAQKVSLPEIATDILPFSVRTDFWRLSAENVATSFTVQFDHTDLSFKNEGGGIYKASANLYAKITGLSGRKAGQFEDSISTGRYTDTQLEVAQSQRSVYQKNVVLPPGRYKIDVVARDVTSGKTGVLHHSFEVPRYQENQLATSTIVLAASIEPVDSKKIFDNNGAFIIGRYKVKPFVSGIYKPGQNLTMFLQVYDAEMDQATLQPALKVEYTIMKGNEEILHIVEDGKTAFGRIDLKGQQLTVMRAVPLQDKLAQPGSYTVKVKITDLVSQKVVTPQTPFTVVNNR
jgi:GWxTD domain-containing protein